MQVVFGSKKLTPKNTKPLLKEEPPSSKEQRKSHGEEQQSKASHLKEQVVFGSKKLTPKNTKPLLKRRAPSPKRAEKIAWKEAAVEKGVKNNVLKPSASKQKQMPPGIVIRAFWLGNRWPP
ncbi:hypothetical protein CEXT_797141 [Caerostris extrusa]|uniref:Uncharacterized protein n=1 Tax=Caerostris extrusa TaxID=172846 RepID=A0AAV4P5M6_CAEEX|nr:hypothetical protein CEXT_797141 [Caerostris extrusa]